MIFEFKNSSNFSENGEVFVWGYGILGGGPKLTQSIKPGEPKYFEMFFFVFQSSKKMLSFDGSYVLLRALRTHFLVSFSPITSTIIWSKRLGAGYVCNFHCLWDQLQCSYKFQRRSLYLGPQQVCGYKT